MHLTSPTVATRKLDAYEWIVAKGRVIRPLNSGFDADLVVHSKPELLLAEVVFRCLDGQVVEKKLNLVELAAR